MLEAMLEAGDIRAGYASTPVLRELSVRVGEGDRVAVLGRNGAGKTTLLRALIGELPLTSGKISFRGEDVSGLPPYRRARLGMAYVPQGRDIFPGLTVLENLRVAAYATRRRDWRAAL